MRGGPRGRTVIAVARLPRNVFPPHGVWHVTTRGVGRRDVFLTVADRLLFLDLLREVRLRFAWKPHAFCLMTNHYHLVLEASLAALSGGMHHLNGTYARAFNAAHGWSGHLWGDRFRLWQVRDDRHLAAACDYVRANPVRAGLCETPTDWQWSDARRAAGTAATTRRAARRP
jgi:putative transposase